MNPTLCTHPRAPAVAGLFYPGNAESLAQEVDALLADAKPAALASGVAADAVKAMIVPHAGYIYSGSTAAVAYALLARRTQRVRRVVLLGPAHRVSLRGIALPEADGYASPLGAVPLDAELATALRALSQVGASGAVHAQEHSLEVQLPFLQRTLADFTLLPLAVGAASAEEVGAVLDAVWGGPETLILISSDLSHFHAYDEARRIDADTLALLAAGQPLHHEQACGATPINGLLLAAKRRGLTPHLLGACNSGDTAGDKRRVVGYASLAFTERAS